ncbi:MAG TPA: hypothetical protein VK789_08310 [Bryobacteraceae bacterium]|jgi:hypothetical protein|nr:hypothetical protein [Bryobacteraceae bacterium]
MDMRIVASGLLLAFAAVIPGTAQDAQPAKVRYVSLIGTVEKIDTAGKVLSIKPDKADETSVKFDDKTQFLRLPAGVTDTKQATRAAASDVATGDRVIARLRAGEEGQPAVFLYFENKAELAQRKEKTAEEWKKDGVTGIASNVDPAGKKLVISVRAAGPPKDVTLDVSGNVDATRYNPENGKNDPSTVASIRVGDQVTVIGQKNADVTEIKVEAITSGFYKTLPVQIKSIDAAAGQILATDIASKKPITITVNADTSLKKLDDATALQLARRLNPTFQNENGRGRGGRGGGGAAADGGAPAQGGGFARGGDAAAGGGQGRGGRGGGGRGIDLGRIIDQQPSIMLTDLKVGEPIVVAGAATDDLSKLRALKLIAGVDPILRAAPQNGPDPLGGNWNLGDAGGGGGQE